MKLHSLLFRRSGAVLAAALLLFLPGLLAAQSLGEAARQARARKTNPPAPANRVYNNDNLPRSGGLSTTEVEAKKDAKDKDKDKDKTDKAKDGDKKDAAEEEKAVREKAKALRDALAIEERMLDVSQRELNQANVQFYSNPDVAMREQNSRAELNKRQAELEKQKEAVEAAKKAIAGLEEDLRRRGLPPGWAR